MYVYEGNGVVRFLNDGMFVGEDGRDWFPLICHVWHPITQMKRHRHGDDTVVVSAEDCAKMPESVKEEVARAGFRVLLMETQRRGIETVCSL